MLYHFFTGSRVRQKTPIGSGSSRAVVRRATSGKEEERAQQSSLEEEEEEEAASFWCRRSSRKTKAPSPSLSLTLLRFPSRPGLASQSES
ncbi:Protein CBG26492 [Caenorhabditis briggsae]|uniref:Protein CBG26492 n=1 Tax=Caenorhabditis briggsae TaxID=6238 RepID=B6IH43_CAEBR|nr:Protein CBG26492 [Caenorhabditis briggsae]CAR99223.1 Protein CBG26492 [Caenorhabditis briggsae]